MLTRLKVIMHRHAVVLFMTSLQVIVRNNISSCRTALRLPFIEAIRHRSHAQYATPP